MSSIKGSHTSPSSSSNSAPSSSSSSSSLSTLSSLCPSSTSSSVSLSSSSSSSCTLSSSASSSSSLTLASSSSWIPLRSVVFIVASHSTSSSSASSSQADRGHLKSPWARRKRKHPLSPQQWINSFGPDGKLRDGGFKFLRKVRSGGIDSSIRAEVWPFLLGLYELNSSKEERDTVRAHNRREYEKLREQCCSILGDKNGNHKFSEIGEVAEHQKGFFQDLGPPIFDVLSDEESISRGEMSPHGECSHNILDKLLEGDDNLKVSNVDASFVNSDSSDSDSSEGPEVIQSLPPTDVKEENHYNMATNISSPSQTKEQLNHRVSEDFSTWRRIIRLDAIRANAEWVTSSPYQDEISYAEARGLAESVGLKDYHELEPSRILHAARLVAILEAYALYDPEIGYCQGMSDLLSPIVSVISEDHEVFWCFVGFMRKARQNFRLDEVGIRRQLNIVSKIIKCTDSHLYRHLEKLQAEDCFFVYRMVVVLFRRELTFEQTMCLWEVMWADQVAIKAGIGKSAWSRIRQRAPPTEDLLLYAIAASVLQKRKLIIEKYSTMDEIVRECNNMSGHLDIWKLLDDAHDLVMNLHYKIESSVQ